MAEKKEKLVEQTLEHLKKLKSELKIKNSDSESDDHCWPEGHEGEEEEDEHDNDAPSGESGSVEQLN